MTMLAKKMSYIINYVGLRLYGITTGSDSVYITLCIAVAFACVGFWQFNIPTPKVFLGDVGSILLGWRLFFLKVYWVLFV